MKLKMKQKTVEKGFKKANGITLIALVVTIVVLLILAGITINYVFSEGGLFDIAKNSGNTWHDAENSDINALNDLNEMIGNLVNSVGSGGTVTPPEEPKPLVTEASLKTTIATKNIEAKDKYGNIVVIPKGFKIATDSGATVPEGIVIEDGASTEAEGIEGTTEYKPATTGNQFVWIPVGTVYMDEERTAEKAKQVELGRYTFADNNSTEPAPGTKNLVQPAFNEDGTANYINIDGTVGVINSSFSELSISREGNTSDDKNATAKNLEAFLTSAKNKGGYYIARFEASCGSGYNASGTDDVAKFANAKPLSKVSTVFEDYTMDFNMGTLWSNLTQLQASKVSRNMYNEDIKVGVESDLMNSYAWETAIVYISQMKEEYANFANFACNTTYGSSNNVVSTSFNNTGVNDGDKFCNIYDMVANFSEWTTESCEGNYCVYRGGASNRDSCFTVDRDVGGANNYTYEIGFRPLCYIK